MKTLFSHLWKVATLSAFLVLAACATHHGWKTRTASNDFVDGTVVLAEVILSASREQVIRGEGILEGWRDTLQAAGHSDQDIVNGSEVTLWTYCYGHNSGVPLCAHHGHYLAHLPEHLRKNIHGDPDSKTDTNGELVEVKLTRMPSGRLFGEVISVYRQSTDWGDCREAALERSGTETALLNLTMVGPPRASWIECTGAENDGWVRRPVVGAPLSRGPPVSEWVKRDEI